MYGIYQVTMNDDLEKIANEVGTTKENLMQINGIVEDMILRPGSFIIVPKYDNNYTKYIVEKGDNMYSIAKKNNVDYKALLKLNGLDEDDYIYPNETILIPKGFNIYITEEETLNDIENKIKIDKKNIVENNPKLIIKEDQIIRY